MDSLIELSLDNEELLLRVKNREDGIRDYLDGVNKLEGKLYITPKGPYSSMSAIQRDFNTYRTSIKRWFESKSAIHTQWFVITGDTPLQPEEVCKYCDEVDDLLFAKDCWMTRVNHTHDTPLKDDDMIEYLFQGLPYSVTYKNLLEGKLPLHPIVFKAAGDATRAADATTRGPYYQGIDVTLEVAGITLEVNFTRESRDYYDKIANGDYHEDLTFGLLSGTVPTTKQIIGEKL